MKTLLVIDMQNAWLAKLGAPCFDSAGVIARINLAAERVRREGGRVVFVQHADADTPAGSDGWQLLPALAAAGTDARVFKTACDSFAGTELGAILKASGTDTLVVCGFATEFCVDTTVRAAASRGLRVIALSDAHTTSNRPHLKADAIVAHHNWIWTNMDCPPDATLTVQSTAQAFPG
jgi:nicotinamidase-related amidase